MDVLVCALKCVCVWMYRSMRSSVYECGCINLCVQVCMCVDVYIGVYKCHVFGCIDLYA